MTITPVTFIWEPLTLYGNLSLSWILSTAWLQTPICGPQSVCHSRPAKLYKYLKRQVLSVLLQFNTDIQASKQQFKDSKEYPQHNSITINNVDSATPRNACIQKKEREEIFGFNI